MWGEGQELQGKSWDFPIVPALPGLRFFPGALFQLVAWPPGL